VIYKKAHTSVIQVSYVSKYFTQHTRSRMAQLVYQIKERPAQCTDITPRETSTLRGAARRSHYRPHYVRNRSTSDMPIGIYSCIDAILHKARTLEVCQIPPETSCMYMHDAYLVFQETVTLKRILTCSR
jgi:hypothetical protein